MQDTFPHKTTGAVLAEIKPPSRLNRKTVWGLILITAVAWSLNQTGIFQQDVINERGWTLAMRFITASVQPELSSDFLWLTLEATITTLAFAVCGTFLSLIIGVFGGIIASEVWWEAFFQIKQSPSGRWSWYRTPWLVIRSMLAVIRAIHEIIWGLFFVNIIGLDPLTAILAIAIPFGAVTAKVFSEILDETARQPFITLQNSGVSPIKAFAYTLLPQAFLDWLGYGFYRFECSIRAAAVLGIIGAGGLGHEIFLSLKTLKYEQIWTLFFALFFLNGLTDFWSGWLRRYLGATVSYTSWKPLAGTVTPTSSRRRRTRQGNLVIRGSFLLVLFLVPFSFWYVAPNVGKLFSERSLQHLDEVARWSFPPDFSVFSLRQWLELAGITLAMSLLATVGAALVGLVLSFPAANNFLLPGGLLDTGRGGRVASVTIFVVSRAVLLVSRSIPPPIWALVFLFVIFPGILPGALALGIYTLGVLGRLMAEVVENLDERPLRALKSLGATSGKIFAYGVLPTTFPRFLAYFLYRWEETIRATVVIGLVGAGGLGRLLTEELSRFNYQGVLTALIVFISLIFAVDLISAAVRRAYRET